MKSTAPMPTALGFVDAASLPDGTYIRTGTTLYQQTTSGQDTSQSYKETLIISGNTVIDIDYLPPAPETIVSGTFAISGTNVTMTGICYNGAIIPPATRTSPFTYSNGVLKLYDSSENKESVFAKQ